MDTFQKDSRTFHRQSDTFNLTLSNESDFIGRQGYKEWQDNGNKEDRTSEASWWEAVLNYVKAYLTFFNFYITL